MFEVEHDDITRATERGYFDPAAFQQMLLHVLVDIRDILQQIRKEL